MDLQDTELIVNSIDIRLVKEQLRLLGHTVDDAVILSFVQGLGSGTAGGKHADAASAGGPSQSSAASDQSGHDTDSSGDESEELYSKQAVTSTPSKLPHAAAGTAGTAARPGQSASAVSDASPSRSQVDQQSPGQQPHSFSSPATRSTLDQRCRKFLARLSERPSSQQLLQQQQQQRQQLLASRELFPRHSKVFDADADETSSSCSDEGSDEDGDRVPMRSCSISIPTAAPAAAALDAIQTSTGTAAGSATGAWHSQLAADNVPKASHRSGRDDLQCLMQMGAACAPLRRTSTKQQQQQQDPQEHVDTSGHAAQQQTAENRPLHIISMLDSGSEVVYEAPTAAHSDQQSELPKYGFRPGYKPVGIHIPPPPYPETIELISKQAKGGSAQYSEVLGTKQQLQQRESLALHLPISPVGSSPSRPQQHHLAPWLDARPCSESIIGDAAADAHEVIQRSRRSSRDGSSGPSDPLFHAPISPTNSNTTAPQVPPSSRSPAKVIAAAARVAVHSAPAAAAAKTRGAAAAAGHGADGSIVAKERGNRSLGGNSSGNCSLSVSAPLSRQVSYSTAGEGGRRVSSSSSSSAGSGLSSTAMYSQQLSFGGRYKRSTAVAPGVQKTDRVARFQQMQQQWQKDRFLSAGSSSSSGGSGRAVTSAGGSSKHSNSAFAAKFAKLHAAEAHSSAAVLRDSRSRTQQAMAAAVAYVPPTSLRRDGLRRMVRQAMQQDQ